MAGSGRPDLIRHQTVLSSPLPHGGQLCDIASIMRLYVTFTCDCRAFAHIFGGLLFQRGGGGNDCTHGKVKEASQLLHEDCNAHHLGIIIDITSEARDNVNWTTYKTLRHKYIASHSYLVQHKVGGRTLKGVNIYGSRRTSQGSTMELIKHDVSKNKNFRNQKKRLWFERPREGALLE